jgi:hypothetical protein
MIGKTDSLWNSLGIVCLKPIVEDSNLYEKVSKTTILVFHKVMGRSHSLLISSKESFRYYILLNMIYYFDRPY